MPFPNRDLSCIILSWQWGNNPTHDEYTNCRGYIFGGYSSCLANYMALVALAKQAFPFLQDMDIEFDRVMHSSRQKGFVFVHFPLPVGTTHPDFRTCADADFWGQGVNLHPMGRGQRRVEQPLSLTEAVTTVRTNSLNVRAAVEALFLTIGEPALEQIQLYEVIVGHFAQLGACEAFIERFDRDMREAAEHELAEQRRAKGGAA